MKVFIDTEFYEFSPTYNVRHLLGGADYDTEEDLPGANAVQLISLGAVREDGAEFYAENTDFDWDNVPDDHWLQGNVRPHLWSERGLLMSSPPAGGLHEPQKIAQEFHAFAIGGEPTVKPELWGYYCDYDWVALCGLYGRMVDLPPEFPMFCMDVKQFAEMLGNPRMPASEGVEHHALSDARNIKHRYDFLASEYYLQTAPDSNMRWSP